jgi:uncharacterized protein YdaU (DUF1376 family)
MERNSPDSQGYKLESQLREAFGRVVYTQTCHNKIVDRLHSINNNTKLFQIVLSAVTTGTFLVTIFSNEKVSAIIGAVFSLILLILNTYIKNATILEDAQSHQKTANALWKIREEYVSLLTDFEILNAQEILHKRDELQNRTYEVYENASRTDARSYKKAREALKHDEEQTFTEDEIDIMLANSIRRNNRTGVNTTCGNNS